MIAATPPSVSAARLARFNLRDSAESRSSVALRGLPPESRDKAGAAKVGPPTFVGDGVSAEGAMICGATAMAARGLVSTTGGAGIGPPRFEEGGTSGGVPRVINLLCDRALTLGAQAGSAVITSDLILQAAEALALRVPAAAVTQRKPIPLWVIALLGVLVIVALILLFAPLDRLVNAVAPAPPRSPALQTAPALAPPPAPAGLPL